jgi:hypothetical protein
VSGISIALRYRRLPPLEDKRRCHEAGFDYHLTKSPEAETIQRLTLKAPVHSGSR